MSVEERDARIHEAARLLLEGFEDPNEYNAEVAWLLAQPVTA